MCESIGHRPLRGRCPKGAKNGSSQFLKENFDQFGHIMVQNDEHGLEERLFGGKNLWDPLQGSSKGLFWAKKGQKMEHLNFTQKILINLIILWFKMMSMD